MREAEQSRLVFHKSAGWWSWGCSLGWTHSVFEVSLGLVIYDCLDWITQLSSTHLPQPSGKLVWALSSTEETYKCVFRIVCVLRFCCVIICFYPIGQSKPQGRDESKCGEVLLRGLGTDRHMWKSLFSHMRRKEGRLVLFRKVTLVLWLGGRWCWPGRSGHRMLVI